ncbi:hypothetical protein EJ02DRAFT_361858, partial [Clathrospora elynae]
TRSHVREWPAEPKTLQASTPSWLYRLLPHFILVLVPLASVGLGIAVLCIDGEPESGKGNALQQAMAVTATLWPILFAAVLGPMLKAFALYRAERGTKVGLLEILLSSQTLVSTLRQCFALRIVGIWPALLVILWSLSPAGGQGALRALTSRQNTTTIELKYASYPTNSLSFYLTGPFENDPSPDLMLLQFRAPIHAAFYGQDVSLLQANTSSPQFADAISRVGGPPEALKITRRDLWRNVRIPMLHTLPQFVQGASDWIIVPTDKIAEYSSLIGVPIRGFTPSLDGNTTLTISTNYQALECNNWVNATEWLEANSNRLATKTSSGVDKPVNYWIDELVDPERILKMSTTRSSLSQTSPLGYPEEPNKKMTLTFYTNYNLTLCEVRTEYVDSIIDCSRTTPNGDLTCAVSKMRRTPGSQGLGNLTALDIGHTNKTLQYIPYTTVNLGGPGLLEKWLWNPPTAHQNFLPVPDGWSAEVPPKVFSNRLTVLLNTFMRGTYNMTINIGSDGTSLDHCDARWANTTGAWTQFTAPVYQVSKPWFALYFIAALVMTVCALANIILRSLVHVPDFFGSISALTRDSLFIDVPTPASGMDGTERARLLQDKLVMIQDVQPDKAIGRIAFSDAVTKVGLRMDRRYA